SEIAIDAVLDVSPFLVTDERNRLPVEAAQTRHDRVIVGANTVAVQLHPIVEQPCHVVERVRTVVVTCELDGLPDVLISRLLRDPRELSLELLELRRDAGTTEQAHVAQTRQAFAQSQLVVSRHSSRRAARAAQRTA